MHFRSGVSTALFSAALVAVAFTSFTPQVPAGQRMPDPQSLGKDEIVTGDGAIVNLKKMSEDSAVRVGCGISMPMQSYRAPKGRATLAIPYASRDLAPTVQAGLNNTVGQAAPQPVLRAVPQPVPQPVVRTTTSVHGSMITRTPGHSPQVRIYRRSNAKPIVVPRTIRPITINPLP